jgi:hypothetical protein
MPLATAEDAREAWRLLQPVLEEVQADARRLARLQGAPLAAAGDAPLEPRLSLGCWICGVTSPGSTRVCACPWLSGAASCMVRHALSEHAQEQSGALLQRRGARLSKTGAGLKIVGCGQFRWVCVRMLQAMPERHKRRARSCWGAGTLTGARGGAQACWRPCGSTSRSHPRR